MEKEYRKVRRTSAKEKIDFYFLFIVLFIFLSISLLLAKSGVQCVKCTGSGGPVQNGSPRGKTMEIQQKEKSTGSNGFRGSGAQGLAQRGWRSVAGADMSSSSNYYKILTWNVRGLNRPGRLANIVQEMRRMEVDIMGIGDFLEGGGRFLDRATRRRREI